MKYFSSTIISNDGITYKAGGTMSVVGPRPHMVKHTKQYSELINNYLVRHYAKPGITGWAQVNGFRGETKELIEMKDRVDHTVLCSRNDNRRSGEGS